MGSNKVSDTDRQNQGFNTGYSMYKPNVNPISIFGTTQSNLNIGAYNGWEAAHNDYMAQQEQEGGMWELFNMFAGMGGPQQPQGPSYEQQQADYAKQLAEQRMAEGRQRTNDLYSKYMDAAGTATDYINSEISREMSNAALLGIDYKIDDATKQSRIENYFASVWGEGEQKQLEGYMGEYGNPTGFTGFTIKRGDASAYVDTQKKEDTLKATSKGLRPSVLEEDETAAKPGTLLGV